MLSPDRAGENSLPNHNEVTESNANSASRPSVFLYGLPPIDPITKERVLQEFNIAHDSKKKEGLKTFDIDTYLNPNFVAMNAARNIFNPFVLEAPGFARALVQNLETNFAAPVDNQGAAIGAMGVLAAYDYQFEFDGNKTFPQILNNFAREKWQELFERETKEVQFHSRGGILLRQLEGLCFPAHQGNLADIVTKLFFVSSSQNSTENSALVTFNVINQNWIELAGDFQAS